MSLDNLSSLLDANLDDLVDMPEFVVPPAGAYNATIKGFEEKKIGEHPAVELCFIFAETLELANPTDAACAPNTETKIAYILDNEYGVGGLKAILAPLKVAFNTTTVRETLEACKGASVMVVTKVRNGKKGTDKEDNKYMSIHKLEVL